MFQNEITKLQKLLDNKGNVANPGFSKKLLWEYDRSQIKAPKALIKEWDYYYIGNNDFALCVTLSDMGYIGALSASVIDYKTPNQITKSAVCGMPMGKFKMANTTLCGDEKWTIGKSTFNFRNDGKKRHLFGNYSKFGKNGEELLFDVELTDAPEESIVIATPFSKKGRFYFNQKINCLKAKGWFQLGEKKYILNEENQSLATLDWGRGVWTYDNTWYWGSLQTILDNGSPFGWNIGYGFGNNEMATENMLFHEGKSHKLDEITFNIPKKKDGSFDYMKDWIFTSNDDRFHMDFKPIIDRYAPFDIKVLAMIPHQVFGNFTGYCVLDNGKKIEISNVLGFAEHVHNKW